MTIHANARNSGADASIKSLSTLLAFVAALFGAPPLYGWTVEGLVQLLSRHYGPQFADLYDILWMVVTFLLVFVPARMVIQIALTVLLSGLVYRFI